MQQIPLKLELLSPYTLRYFVPHSGSAEAIEVFERSLADLQREKNSFRLIFLYGAEGTGKTHLALGYRERAIELGISCLIYHIQELNTVESVREFIDATESARASGGLVIIEGRALPTESKGLAAHVTSRLLSGYTVKLGYPSEEELRPLLLSILERRSLRLPEHSLQGLLRLLPANPLSMERIVRALDELALREKRKVNFGIIRQVNPGLE